MEVIIEMESIMMDQIDQQEKNTGLGKRLKHAREALNLSEKEAAIRLHLNVKVIRTIEDEVFKDSLPPTFLRGYVRSYARLLHIPEDEVNDALDKLNLTTKPTAVDMTSLLTTGDVQNSTRYVQWTTYSVISVLVILVGMWWSSHPRNTVPDKSNQLITQEAPALPPAPASKVVTTTAPIAPAAPVASVGTSTPGVVAPAQPSISATTSVTTAPAASAAPNVAPAAAPVVATVPTTQPQQPVPVAQPLSPAVTTSVNPAAQPPVPQPSAAPLAPPQPTAVVAATAPQTPPAAPLTERKKSRRNIQMVVPEPGIAD